MLVNICFFCFFSVVFFSFFFFQAEDGIRDLVRSRGLGDVYKRQLFAPNLMIVDIYIPNVRYVFYATRLECQPG